MLAALPARADDVASAVGSARGQALPLDGSVDGFAQSAAERIAAAQDLVHSDLSTLLGPCTAAGEVIGYGPDLSSVMSAFATSPGHWTTINKPTWNAMGTGEVFDSNGRLWVVVVFCTLSGTPPTPPTTTTPPQAPTTSPPATTTPPSSAGPAITSASRAHFNAQSGPTIDSAQRVQLISRKVGLVTNLENNQALLTGTSPLLDEEEWRQPRVPSVS
jgi:hypothetical protein